jgi:hypothetical protein
MWGHHLENCLQHADDRAVGAVYAFGQSARRPPCPLTAKNNNGKTGFFLLTVYRTRIDSPTECLYEDTNRRNYSKARWIC